jgi:hypothetical protein
MELSKQSKIGLEDTPMLILGRSDPFGFLVRRVFSEIVGELPAISRYLDATGLALMILVIALVITAGLVTALSQKGTTTSVFSDSPG